MLLQCQTITCTIVPVTPFQQNCTLVVCNKTKKCAVVDPGGDVDVILGALRKQSAKVEKIWITHGHLDHGGGAKALKAATGATIEGPAKEDAFWIQGIDQHASQYGIGGMESFTPDRWLRDGDKVTLGETEWDIIHSPGHTPGHVVFYNKENNLAFVGDVLFKGSIGRADFPGSDPNQLMRSITEKLWPLGDVTFVPGHGQPSTFSRERDTNPYVGDKVLGR